MMDLESYPADTPEAPPKPHERRKMTKLQSGVGAISALLALGLAGYSFYGSYESIKGLASEFDFKSPELVPIGIDGGLLGAVFLDLFTTWIGHPIGLLRMSSRLFTVGTVLVNAMAGWNKDAEPFDNVQAITLHVFAPLLLLVIVESVRHLLMELLREDDTVEVFDTVGVANWALRPWPAFLIWRRMKISKIGSYTAAQEFELRRLQAIGRLKTIYPGRFRAWRKSAPPDLVYKLTKGFRLDEACDQVEKMAPGSPSGTPRRDPAKTISGTPSAVGAGSPLARVSGAPSGTRPGTPSAKPLGTPAAVASGTPSAAASGTPAGRGWGTPDGLTETEKFERRIEIIKAVHGTEIPGVKKIRETLSEVGWGVAQDGTYGAKAIRNALHLRAGLKPPTELISSVNGSTTN